MIVIEGPDGAGKSTLVQTLVDHFGPKGLVQGDPRVEDRSKMFEVERANTYRALAEDLTEPVSRVWDRLYFSELVYCKTRGMECAFNDADQELIRDLLIAHAAPIICCLPPFDTVRENVNSDEQMEGVSDNLGQIYADYQRLYFGSGPVSYYDYTGETRISDEYRSLDAILSRVEAQINHRARRF